MFDNKLEYNNYYENCIYKKVEIKQVPKFDSYNITTMLGMIYKHIVKYSNLLLSSKRDRLFPANLIKIPKLQLNILLYIK